MPKNKQRKGPGRKKAVNRSQGAWTATYANSPMGDRHISLRGFLQQQLPDTTMIKMVYSDYRALGAAGSQASYVYRLNSCFDPDFTGVGGQPDGFDQWKTLYQQYRVMACDVQVHAVALAGCALATISPSVSSGVSGSAEENIGLRRASGALTNVSGQVAKLHSLYRIGDIFGVPDSSVLDNDNYAATVTSSPSSAAYLRVEAETSGATDTVMIWVVLTMYTRFEKPVDTQDSVALSRGRSTIGAPRGAVTAPQSMNTGLVESLESASTQLARISAQLKTNAPTSGQPVDSRLLPLLPGV